MGHVTDHRSVLLLLGAFSRHDEALRWAQLRAQETWGPIAKTSEPFAFEETDYYTESMGPGLKMSLIAFERLVDPGCLASTKTLTNRWEEEYRQSSDWPEERPLNLDPGYLTEAKLVLASTKDHRHRIYLSDGIFAEVTLFYRHRKWQSSQWTYPNYARDDYHAFFDECRDYLRGCYGKA